MTSFYPEHDEGTMNVVRVVSKGAVTLDRTPDAPADDDDPLARELDALARAVAEREEKRAHDEWEKVAREQREEGFRNERARAEAVARREDERRESEERERKRRAALVDVQAVIQPYLQEAYQAGYAAGLRAADSAFRDCPE